MQKPSLGWQSWSPPLSTWHKYPRWDYAPIKVNPLKISTISKSNKVEKIRYWCSWYAFGWNINHNKIINTLKTIKDKKLPFTHIIIDDGWTIWGDWHFPNKRRFQNFDLTLNTIKDHKLKAGLWFAPFLANKKSQLFKNRPEWFLLHNGKPVQGLKTMPFWESLIPQQYILNFELQEVKKYITDFIDKAVKDWGITLLKLDFLYAPYFAPNLKTDKIPHKQITWLLKYIKNKYPNVTIIACGTPFAPALGIADIIRISKDTALPPNIPRFINRFFYHKRVHMLNRKLQAATKLSNINFDPDVRILSLDSVKTQQIWDKINKTVISIGDDITRLNSSKISQLKKWLQ